MSELPSTLLLFAKQILNHRWFNPSKVLILSCDPKMEESLSGLMWAIDYPRVVAVNVLDAAHQIQKHPDISAIVLVEPDPAGPIPRQWVDIEWLLQPCFIGRRSVVGVSHDTIWICSSARPGCEVLGACDSPFHIH